MRKRFLRSCSLSGLPTAIRAVFLGLQPRKGSTTYNAVPLYLLTVLVDGHCEFCLICELVCRALA